MDREEYLSKKKIVKKITLDDGSEHNIVKLSQGDVKTITKKYSDKDKVLEGFQFGVVKCVVDEDGKRIFSDDDMDKLTGMDFDLMSQLAGEISEYSGLTKKEKKD